MNEILLKFHREKPINNQRKTNISTKMQPFCPGHFLTRDGRWIRVIVKSLMSFWQIHSYSSCMEMVCSSSQNNMAYSKWNVWVCLSQTYIYLEIWCALLYVEYSYMTISCNINRKTRTASIWTDFCRSHCS